LSAHPCRILRPIVDEQQQPGGRQAVDEAVQQRLGLGVDPVQVLDQQQERLDHTCSLAARAWVTA
jgi:hypothetical protein